MAPSMPRTIVDRKPPGYPTPSWKTGIATSAMRWGNFLWTGNINQHRPHKSTPTLKQLLDVFQLPPFNFEAGTTNLAPASPPPSIALRRSTRIHGFPL
ncbi:unnamed protein product [Toxocara canis]|uniref:Uncharacterized protein n=1 Tax=Toxocara canis TaxID=6265 RepID=A0A183UW82_TOXCA|nr:unnamed protein product [Toxocara canis]